VAEPISYTSHSIQQFVQKLSSKEPIPGGGSAAALVGVLACSLSQMVGGIFAKRVRDTVERHKLNRLLRYLETENRRIQKVVDEDPKAFHELMQTYRIPKGVRNRRARIDRSLEKAFRVQANLARLLVSLKKANGDLKARVDGSIRNDLLLSEAFTRAAFQGAVLTAAINWKFVKDPRLRARLGKEISLLRKEFGKR
jgi:formiminotetrahydrofolate cyclodeaminase